MDSYNHHATRKRKRDRSKEENEDLRKKNHQSVGCFGRCCCNAKQHDETVVRKDKLLKRSTEQIPLENITQPAVSIKQVDTFLDKPTHDTNLNNFSASEKLNPFEGNINSFINNIIGDGIDRVSEVPITITTCRNGQTEIHMDNELSKNSEDIFRENDSKRKPANLEGRNQYSNFTQQQQRQYSGLVFEKQSLKRASEMSHHSSVALSSDHASFSTIPKDYNWSLTSNKTNYDQEKTLNKENASQDQESYNWDYQEYPQPSSLELSQHNHLIDNPINDKNSFVSNDDNTDPSYSISSVLSLNKIQKSPSQKNDLKKHELSDETGIIVDQQKASIHSQLKISVNESNNLKHTKPNQNGKFSSELMHHQEILEQNDRFSATSVSDLFRQFINEKKQKSFDLDSISTAYSIPVSMRPSVLPEMITNKNHAQLPQTIVTDRQEKPPSDNQMKWWRYSLDRLLGFILPSTHTTVDHNINLSPSIIASNTHSWSTLTCAETENMIQSNNIGPWWSRRDVYDQTSATFIFANEPFNAWYSIDMMTSNKQMCTSVTNRPCYAEYYSCPNTCYCCCSSSTNVNNNSLSS